MAKFRVPRPTRNSVLFVAGLLGLAYVTVFGGTTEKPTLIIAFLGMMGTPIFLRSDESRQKEVEEADPTDPASLLGAVLNHVPSRGTSPSQPPSIANPQSTTAPVPPRQSFPLSTPPADDDLPPPPNPGPVP